MNILHIFMQQWFNLRFLFSNIAWDPQYVSSKIAKMCNKIYYRWVAFYLVFHVNTLLGLPALAGESIFLIRDNILLCFLKYSSETHTHILWHKLNVFFFWQCKSKHCSCRHSASLHKATLVKERGESFLRQLDSCLFSAECLWTPSWASLTWVKNFLWRIHFPGSCPIPASMVRMLDAIENKKTLSFHIKSSRKSTS